MDVCVNLGKVNLTSMQQDGTSGSGYLYDGSTATTNVNAAINAAAGGTALNTDNYYWSASEYGSNYAVFVYFESSGVDVSNDGKTNSSYYYVRAVLAF